MIKLLKPIIFFIVISAQIVEAEEPRHISVSADAFHTSDDLSLQRYNISYMSNRREVTYPYKDAAEQAFDWGVAASKKTGSLNEFDFESDYLGLAVGRKFSKTLYLGAKVGAGYFSNKDLSKTLFSPGLRLEYVKENKIVFQGFIDRSFMFESEYAPGPVLEGISMWNIKPYMTFYYTKYSRFIIRPELSLPTDGNKRIYVDAAYMYALSLWPVWLWVGFGGEHLTNSLQSSYWSPAQFYSYGLRFEFESTIYKMLSASVGANINRMQEDDFEMGRGHYINASLIYGHRDGQNIRLEYTNIESLQGSSTWQSNKFMLKWNYFF